MKDQRVIFRSLILLGLFVASMAAPAWSAPPDYARDVRPIFEKHCYACHGPTKQTSGYRLDIREIALKGGESGDAAIVPHNADKSLLIQYVSDPDPAGRMPPQAQRSRPAGDVASQYVYIYIYIHREREIERERDIDRHMYVCMYVLVDY